MAKKKIFKTDFVQAPRPTDPEALFRNLRGRAPEIRHLWSHQADILRRYFESHLGTRDVAFELPTGTGKTLIGLLIAEFRRQAYGERLVYLSPNRMLAKQVGAKAVSYGIPAHVLVGPQDQYPITAFNQYAMGDATAITTYSGLFNTNPKLNDAHVIILDDAHAGENFIAGLWSVELSRKDDLDTLTAIFDLFAPRLPSAFAQRLKLTEVRPEHRRLVELVPGPYYRECLNSLRDILNARLKKPDSAWYAWKMIEGMLEGCNLFLSWQGALIRPVIPPTHLHGPFSEARQRIYMSATLGEGGELERITGIRAIHRIPLPAGWDKQTSGRRLFLLPQLSLGDEDAETFITEATHEADRALVLTPHYGLLDSVREIFEGAGLTILGADDVEDSLDSFTSASQTALGLASRYDGIDLPDEQCRLLIVSGLPAGTHLQEQFLLSRLAAVSLLRDRIATRLTQAVGRCTRSDTDYAAVVLTDQDLVRFAIKSETRSILHPELQAELEFGIQNSQEQAAADLHNILHSFLEQDENWKDAEAAIKHLRNTKMKALDPLAGRLREAAQLEVDYIQAMWRQDYSMALEKARAISDILEGDQARGYRGWWYYLTADAALLAYGMKSDPGLLAVARDYFGRASKCAPAISWLAGLGQLQIQGQPVAEVDPTTALAMEGAAQKLNQLGLAGSKFESVCGALVKDIRSNHHDSFCRGLKQLGILLGLESEIPGGDAAPDCLWSLSGLIYLVFEIKVEASPGDPIAPAEARQASGHINWVKANQTPASGVPITGVLLTPRSTVAKATLPHAANIHRIDPKVIRTLADTTVAALRRARAEAGGADDEVLQEKLRLLYSAARLTPKAIETELRRSLVTSLKVVG